MKSIIEGFKSMQENSSKQFPDRRAVVKSAVVGGAAAILPGSMIGNVDAFVPDDIKTDKQCIMEAGLTEAEADCWEKTAAAAGAFFQLPQLHPEDQKEVAVAIHVIQTKLLGRPTYRKYLEVAKANHDQLKQNSRAGG